MKAVNVKVMDVRKVTDVADCMVIASGNSDRHVRSIADRVVRTAKAAGFRPMGIEGERDGEWVLVDLNDVIVHVMLPRVREFYGLEGLWESRHPDPARPASRRKTAKPAKPARAAPPREEARPRRASVRRDARRRRRRQPRARSADAKTGS